MTEDKHSEFDIEILADKTIEMLGVSQGQVIWIWASTHSLDFVEALARLFLEQWLGFYWAAGGRARPGFEAGRLRGE